MIKITLPASSANLGSGFDSMGLALSCYNTIEFERIDRGLIIEVPGDYKGIIPKDEKNLIYRVFESTLRRFSVDVPGIRFIQKNDIPAMRGMGSSSACVVGGVVMANHFMGNRLTKNEIIDICAEEEGHPDNILPTILGGIAVGCMEDGQVRYASLPVPKSLKCAVFTPPFPLSTKKARAVMPKTVPHKDAVFNLSRAALLSAAFAVGDLSLLPVATQDRIHQPFRRPLIPEYDDICNIACEAGALTVCLSGAGPTIIALLDGDDGFEQRAKPMLKKLSYTWNLSVLDIDTCGYKVEE